MVLSQQRLQVNFHCNIFVHMLSGIRMVRCTQDLQTILIQLSLLYEERQAHSNIVFFGLCLLMHLQLTDMNRIPLKSSPSLCSYNFVSLLVQQRDRLASAVIAPLTSLMTLQVLKRRIFIGLRNTCSYFYGFY